MTQKLKQLIICLSFIFAGLMFVPAVVSAVIPAMLGDGCKTSATQQDCLKKNSLVKQIQLVVNFLSGGVAVVIAGSIIVGGIQYTFAGNQPQQTTNARNRIINSVIALFTFLLTFAFLQWLIPGGLFG